MSDEGGLWDAVFASRDLDRASRFEETPTHSVELLRPQPGSVIDIGPARPGSPTRSSPAAATTSPSSTSPARRSR